ncbi:MAG: hypothetical protein ABJB16_08280 [Saprospiraceae bacterium]
MSHKPQFYTALALFFIGMACHYVEKFPFDYKGDQLHFGQGGGFSGIVTYYVLLKDGRLFQRGFRDSSFTYQTRWPDKFVNQMFDNYVSLGLDKIDHYQPGDLYYFIEYHKAGKSVHRIGWGRPGFTPDDNTVLFYNLLYRSTKSKS